MNTAHQVSEPLPHANYHQHKIESALVVRSKQKALLEAANRGLKTVVTRRLEFSFLKMIIHTLLVKYNDVNMKIHLLFTDLNKQPELPRPSINLQSNLRLYSYH